VRYGMVLTFQLVIVIVNGELILVLTKKNEETNNDSR
jgi:hypothetical protein